MLADNQNIKGIIIAEKCCRFQVDRAVERGMLLGFRFVHCRYDMIMYTRFGIGEKVDAFIWIITLNCFEQSDARFLKKIFFITADNDVTR